VPTVVARPSSTSRCWGLGWSIVRSKSDDFGTTLVPGAVARERCCPEVYEHLDDAPTVVARRSDVVGGGGGMSTEKRELRAASTGALSGSCPSSTLVRVDARMGRARPFSAGSRAGRLFTVAAKTVCDDVATLSSRRTAVTGSPVDAWVLPSRPGMLSVRPNVAALIAGVSFF